MSSLGIRLSNSCKPLQWAVIKDHPYQKVSIKMPDPLYPVPVSIYSKLKTFKLPGNNPPSRLKPSLLALFVKSNSYTTKFASLSLPPVQSLRVSVSIRRGWRHNLAPAVSPFRWSGNGYVTTRWIWLIARIIKAKKTNANPVSRQGRKDANNGNWPTKDSRGPSMTPSYSSSPAFLLPGHRGG